MNLTQTSQLGIQFVQIGNDWEATKFLTRLDDNLKGDQNGQVGRVSLISLVYTL